MTPVLRPFQAELKDAVYHQWNAGAINVVMQLATGGGKTVTLSDIVREHKGASCIIAHRQELLSQLSLTLARYGVRHNLVASDGVKRSIARKHVDALGYSMYDPAARCVVAGVDGLVRAVAKLPALAAWAAAVTLWVVDEGHHLVDDNKWHKAISLFTHPNVRGLLPTATPVRADGKGLGRAALGGDGVADVIVEGPSMRWLIDRGFLSDYRIVCPQSDLVMLTDVAASGDWSTKQLREASQRSHITGDVVKNYLHWAKGKLAITFATDVQTAGEMVNAYIAAGVRAALLTGETDDYVRRATIERFSARELDVIVAVDIISEGFDLPGIECLIMARPTASLSLYMQQFGRALRVMVGKDKALILDLVSNVIRHGGPPDKVRVWSLERRGKRASRDSDAIPITVCPNCFTPFERVLRVCPYCGHYEPPATRSSPKAVDGDLAELSPEVLAALRAAVEAVDKSVPVRRAELMQTGWSSVIIQTHLKHHGRRLDAQEQLRESMSYFGGIWHARGDDDSTIQRRFYHMFGLSAIEAMALNATEAEALKLRIDGAVNTALMGSVI